jgi:hypothetical protein
MACHFCLSPASRASLLFLISAPPSSPPHRIDTEPHKHIDAPFLSLANRSPLAPAFFGSPANRRHFPRIYREKRTKRRLKTGLRHCYFRVQTAQCRGNCYPDSTTTPLTTTTTTTPSLTVMQLQLHRYLSNHLLRARATHPQPQSLPGT